MEEIEIFSIGDNFFYRKPRDLLIEKRRPQGNLFFIEELENPFFPEKC